MQSSTLSRKPLVCLVTLLLAAIPILSLTGCGSGIGPAGSSQQNGQAVSSPSVNSVSPISGPAAGGTTVTISGSDFQAGASVTFGGFGATSVKFTNSSTLVAVTPQHAAGSASIAVTNPNGQSSTLASGFTFHTIDLLWSAPSTSSITIIGYNIYRASSTAGPFGKLNGATPLATTSFEDPNVEGDTTYYYEVTSVGSNGTESPPAGPVPATTSP